MKKKQDFFCKLENERVISRKNLALLKRFVTRFWDIKPKKYTWNSVKHQKLVRSAIIRARELWLIDYIK